MGILKTPGARRETVMRKTRRDFVKGAVIGAAGLTIAGALDPWAAAAEKKFSRYFHDFVYKKGTGGPGAADHFFRMEGKDLNNTNTNFSFGYYSKTGAWNTAQPAGCTHPYNECLVFAGLNPKDPHYLGAEIEIALGPDYEKHVIDVPSIVCIPKDLPHGPIVTRKVEKPFAHYSIGLAGNYQATKLPGNPAGTSSKNEYGHLIKLMSDTESLQPNVIGTGNADWLTWPKSKDLEGFIVNFTWGFYSGLGDWHGKIPGFDPHIHEGDEFLCYVGLDPERPDYLGAEVEFYMGEHKDESFMIDRPLVTVAPSGVWHAPAITKKVDQTYIFFLIRTDSGEFYSPPKEKEGA
jgi:hypothetical protein